MLRAVIRVEDHHNRIGPGRELPNDIEHAGVRRRARQVPDASVVRTAGGGRIDGDDLSRTELIEHAGEIERAAAVPRARLHNQAGTCLGQNLLVDPKVERAFDQRYPEPCQPGLHSQSVVELMEGAHQHLSGGAQLGDRALLLCQLPSRDSKLAVPNRDLALQLFDPRFELLDPI